MAALEILNVVEKTLVTLVFQNQGVKKEREMASSTDRNEFLQGAMPGALQGTLQAVQDTGPESWA